MPRAILFPILIVGIALVLATGPAVLAQTDGERVPTDKPGESPLPTQERQEPSPPQPPSDEDAEDVATDAGDIAPGEGAPEGGPATGPQEARGPALLVTIGVILALLVGSAGALLAVAYAASKQQD